MQSTTPTRKSLDDLLKQAQTIMENNQMDSLPQILLKAWHEALDLMERKNITSLEEFDRQHPTCMRVVDLIGELEDALRVMTEEGDLEYIHERLALCQIVLDRFGAELKKERCAEDVKCGLPETYFLLGNHAKADELFEQWLTDTPQWGNGWRNWALCYCTAEFLDGHFEKAETILRRGLAVPLVEDGGMLKFTLWGVLKSLKRWDEADALGAELFPDESSKTSSGRANVSPKFKDMTAKFFANEQRLCCACAHGTKKR